MTLGHDLANRDCGPPHCPPQGMPVAWCICLGMYLKNVALAPTTAFVQLWARESRARESRARESLGSASGPLG
eukprot:773965-Pelagomonas_calceolata.AAC.1